MNESILLFDERLRAERKAELETTRARAVVSGAFQKLDGFYTVLKLVRKVSDHTQRCKYADYSVLADDDVARLSVNEYLCRKAVKRLYRETELRNFASNCAIVLAAYKDDATE